MTTQRELHLKIIELHNKGFTQRAIQKEVHCRQNIITYAIKNKISISNQTLRESKTKAKRKRKREAQKLERDKLKEKRLQELYAEKRNKLDNYMYDIKLIAKHLQAFGWSKTYSIKRAEYLLKVSEYTYIPYSEQLILEKLGFKYKKGAKFDKKVRLKREFYKATNIKYILNNETYILSKNLAFETYNTTYQEIYWAFKNTENRAVLYLKRFHPKSLKFCIQFRILIKCEIKK